MEWDEVLSEIRARVAWRFARRAHQVLPESCVGLCGGKRKKMIL